MTADVATETDLAVALAAALAPQAEAENDNTAPVDWDQLAPLILKLARGELLGL